MACRNNHNCDTCPKPCSSEIKEVEHNKWYTSLPVKDKELVTGVNYPDCTEVWLSWTQDERQAAIAKSGIKRAPRKKTTSLGHDF